MGSAGAQQRQSAAHSSKAAPSTNIFTMRIFVALLLTAAAAYAQAPDWADQIGYTHAVDANVVYNVASGEELKLDVYRPRNVAAPVPVLMWIHGGGWVAGTKEASALRAIPTLAMGMAFV